MTKKLFSALNEEHQFLSQQRSSLVYLKVALALKLSNSNLHGESVLTF